MTLHIGVDLDGVMFDYTENITRFILDSLAEVAPHDTAKRDLILDTPPSQWHFYRDWGYTDEEFVAFNQQAAAAGKLYRGGIEPGWVTTLGKLKAAGHSVHIITARFEGAPGPTADWLIQHEVPHDALTFAKDKSKLGLDVLIDDRHENIADWVATGAPGILYDKPWNQHSNVGAIRAYNPEHVAAAIAYLDDQIIADRQRAEERDAPPEPETILQEAQRLVHGDRGEDYGHPAEDLQRTGRIWGAILGSEDVPAWKVALCMVGVKISREVNAPKRDNLADLAGYAEVVHMTYERLPR